jgi:nucleotide-binding universal stress UspA family protein
MKNKATLLVTTDLSTHSSAGMRFAIQLAAQTQSKLVFYHAIELLTPTSWTKEAAIDFVDNQIKNGEEQLDKFVKTVFVNSTLPVQPYEYVVQMGMDADNMIVNYAKKINADFICMSTRGAGALKKIIGTNASTLVNTSPIPVIVVPENYRIKPITKVGYASDFEHLDSEMPLVQVFAAVLKAKLDVYHYNYKLHETNSKAVFESIKDKYAAENVFFHEPEVCLDYSLVEHLQKIIKKEQPSLLVMFTQQKDNWFERFFFESKTSNMAFDSTIPLLTIGK